MQLDGRHILQTESDGVYERLTYPNGVIARGTRHPGPCGARPFRLSFFDVTVVKRRLGFVLLQGLIRRHDSQVALARLLSHLLSP